MKKSLYPALLFLFASIIVRSQPGANDPTFNSADTGFGIGEKADGDVNALVIQQDGKIIIGGNFINYDGVRKNRIARLNADGSLDQSFNSGMGVNSIINTIALQGDQKILIGGSFSGYDDNVSKNVLARLNPDGTLDQSFNTVFTSTNFIANVAPLPNGKILVAGSFVGRIMRLNADGSKDATFTPGTGASAPINVIKVQADGKILIGGDFTSYNGTPMGRIARLNEDGTLDTEFDPGAGADAAVRAIAVQPGDGRILLGGDFGAYNGTSAMVDKIIRLNASGSLDGGFTSPGTGINGSVRSIAVQSDGKIVAVGNVTYFDGVTKSSIMRLTTTGVFDGGFNVSALTNSSQNLRAVALEADGKIIVAGTRFMYGGLPRHGIGRLNADGTLHNSFVPAGGGANGNVNTISAQGDGKIIIAGDFRYYNGVLVNRIARLNTDGTLDGTFNASGSGPDNAVWASAIQSDGKIIIAGSFTSYNGTAIERIARLNADGSLDGTFTPGAWQHSTTYLPDATIYAVAIQSSGKIIIGGTFLPANATADLRSRIARLNTNGTLDATFQNAVGASGSAVTAITIQPDGKILIGGNFTSYNGTARSCIARLDAEGNLDATFDPGTGVSYSFGDPYVRVITIQPDNKIMIGGDLTSYNGTERSRIARIHTDGTVDTSFKPGTSGANNTVHTIKVKPNGKMVIGGAFAFYGDGVANRLVGLNADGSKDETFALSSLSGATGTVFTSVLLPDGNILIGGAFTAYAGVGRNRVARLLNTCLNNVTVGVPTLNASETVTCSGRPATLSISTGTLPAGAQWKWYTGSCGETAAGAGSSITVAPEVVTTYYVRAEGICVTPGGNCASILLNGTTMQNPVVPTLAASETTLCDGDQATLSIATGTLPLGGQWKWYAEFCGGGTSIGSGTSITVSPQNSTTYYVKAEGNCVSPVLCASISILRSAPQIISPSVTCEDGTVSLKATATAGTVKWYGPDENYLGQGTVLTVPSAPVRSVYYAEAYKRDNCVSSRISLEAANINNVVTSIDGNTFIAAADNIAGVSYQWQNCTTGTAIGGATGKAFTASADGSYAVMVNDQGCYSISDCVDIVITGTEEGFTPGQSVVFPNPSKGKFTVDLGKVSYKSIRITDLNGKTIYLSSGIQRGRVEINLSPRPGLYVLTASGGERETLRSKIIVE